MRRSAEATFHGFALAQGLRAERGSRSLTAHGTLYKALGRLEELGLLTSQWEDGEAAEGRPRRRLYELRIVLVPLVAMQVTDEVDWGLFDVAFAAALLGGTGLLLEPAARKPRRPPRRVASGRRPRRAGAGRARRRAGRRCGCAPRGARAAGGCARRPSAG